MAHFMPPQLMAFFRPPPPLQFRPPLDKQKMPAYSGIASYVAAFAAPPPPAIKRETPQERRAKRAKKRAEQANLRIARQAAKWDPKKLEKEGMTSEPYKTLFVARLAYDITETDLKHEFEYFGPVKNVVIVRDKKGKSRGYGFVEFDSSKDFDEAVREADGRKINGRRILVDVERGRTVKNWRPRRLGGGLGGTRIGGKDVNRITTGRDASTGLPSRGGSSYDDRDRDRDRGRERDRGDRDYRSGRYDRPRSRSRSRDRDRGRSDRDRDSYRDRDRGRSDRDRSRERDGRRDSYRSDPRRDRSASPRRRR